MDLQEEYFNRKSVPAHLIRYPEQATLFLKAKKQKDYNWLKVNISYHLDSQHPPKYLFSVVANPIIYSSPELAKFSYGHQKQLIEEYWEWDAYEKNILNWIRKNSAEYEAVSAKQAVFSSWEMFLQNYDSWLAAFLPSCVIDWIAGSLENPNEQERLELIQNVENWVSHRYEKFHSCWKNVKSHIDKSHYADWLATIINNFDKKNI